MDVSCSNLSIFPKLDCILQGKSCVPKFLSFKGNGLERTSPLFVTDFCEPASLLIICPIRKMWSQKTLEWALPFGLGAKIHRKQAVRRCKNAAILCSSSASHHKSVICTQKWILLQISNPNYQSIESELLLSSRYKQKQIYSWSRWRWGNLFISTDAVIISKCRKFFPAERVSKTMW